MKYTVTGAQMKQIDQDTMERIGIPSLVLMERAALAVAQAVQECGTVQADGAGAAQKCGTVQADGAGAAQKCGTMQADGAGAVQTCGAGRKVLIACGTGNNGADGIAVGRILKGRGCEVTVLLAGNPDHVTEEHRTQQQIAERLGVCMVRFGEETDLSQYEQSSYDVIVDALFGIGLGRPIEGTYRKLLEILEKHTEAKVVAVDIPSGIHADSGMVMGIALKADVTVTFGYVKTGMLLYPGKGYAGKIVVADIGFSDVSLERTGWDGQLLTKADLARLPKRRADGNKGTFGRVLVIAGSHGMSGAAYLSALAAYRTGAGLVKVLTVPENRTILQTQLPEAIVETYDPEAVMPGEEFQKFLETQCDWADVIVMGPGIGKESYVESLVEMVLGYAYVPIVLDADGLNAVAEHPHLARFFTENIIVTPHMGEMSRLTGSSVAELKTDAAQAVRDYSSRHGVVCVMKDAATLTADKEGTLYVNESGCSAMAKAGSGDVLTGVIAGLLARGMEGAEAAAFGVFLHGLAGEEAAARLGENGLLARDIADHLRW